jgi:hypothetical protein
MPDQEAARGDAVRRRGYDGMTLQDVIGQNDDGGIEPELPGCLLDIGDDVSSKSPW